MSKKAIKKVVSGFTLGGALDVFGFKQQEAQEKADKQNARAQEEQARQQAAQAAEAAAQAARQQQLDAERQQVTQAAAEQKTVQTETPTITLAIEDAVPVGERRKRFRGQSVGGSSGASLRV